MDVLRIAAFSDGDNGGNPAGVLIADVLPDAAKMQSVAAEVGYSETAFAAPDGDNWRVRYFSPESEVPFCGHATIALGAALVRQFGDGIFRDDVPGTRASHVKKLSAGTKKAAGNFPAAATS